MPDTYALLDALFAHAPVGLAFWDGELRYQRINNALAEMNGRAPEEHLGRTPRDILGPELGEKVNELLRRVRDEGQPLVEVELEDPSRRAPPVPRQLLPGARRRRRAVRRGGRGPRHQRAAAGPGGARAPAPRGAGGARAGRRRPRAGRGGVGRDRGGPRADRVPRRRGCAAGRRRPRLRGHPQGGRGGRRPGHRRPLHVHALRPGDGRSADDIGPPGSARTSAG